MLNGQWKYKTSDIYRDLLEFQQKLDQGGNVSQTVINDGSIMTLKLNDDESMTAGMSQRNLQLQALENP